MKRKSSAGLIETLRNVSYGPNHNRNPAHVPLEITWRPPGDLKDYEGHSRRHSRRQIRKLARSIESFGFVAPVLVDPGSVIIAGHALVAAAKRLQLPEIPVAEISHLKEPQIRALRLALNRLAEDAKWDEAKLRNELAGLIIDAPEIEIIDTGFETAEIDRLLILPGVDDEDPVPALPDVPVSRSGDLWQLGPHRIFCGDALNAASYAALLDGEKARLMFTDPPYNVKVQGHIRGKGRVQHEEFLMASGELDEASFTDFLGTFMSHAVANSEPGALHLVCMDWRHLEEILSAGRAAYGRGPLNLIVWAKENAGQGSLYRSRHELIVLWKVGEAPHTNNILLGKHGRYRSNIWTYPGVNSFGKGRDRALADHPTVKPLAMVADAILDLSNRGDLVVDPFGGSGTTLLAAHETGRRARLMELDHRYVDVTLRRWRERTGEAAIEINTGQSFEELAHTHREKSAATSLDSQHSQDEGQFFNGDLEDETNEPV
ncbi:site-specific DNA-methyltransferase [Aestuariivirga sp.]|uniref:site-specific DNA-methyltransferase n=1 Tax=Aestuariivirga sp. TaxID=2650926 RepID=UPI00391AF182